MREFIYERRLNVQALEGGFNANFPNGNHADPDRRSIVLNRCFCVPAKASVVFDPPDQNMRIEQDIHSSAPNARARSGGKGSSKVSRILIRPLSRPGFRSNFFCSNGINRAIGLPALAIMISLPAAASSTKADNCVFAA